MYLFLSWITLSNLARRLESEAQQENENVDGPDAAAADNADTEHLVTESPAQGESSTAAAAAHDETAKNKEEDEKSKSEAGSGWNASLLLSGTQQCGLAKQIPLTPVIWKKHKSQVSFWKHLPVHTGQVFNPFVEATKGFWRCGLLIGLSFISELKDRCIICCEKGVRIAMKLADFMSPYLWRTLQVHIFKIVCFIIFLTCVVEVRKDLCAWQIHIHQNLEVEPQLCFAGLWIFTRKFHL